jgi:hypothetical protein
MEVGILEGDMTIIWKWEPNAQRTFGIFDINGWWVLTEEIDIQMFLIFS